jgi:hypothetical protein
VAMLLFMVSSVFSFISMRFTKNQDSYEKYADVIFICALGFLCLITILLFFGFID